MEHTFAYSGHEEVWKDASPFTPAEIVELHAYCKVYISYFLYFFFFFFFIFLFYFVFSVFFN